MSDIDADQLPTPEIDRSMLARLDRVTREALAVKARHDELVNREKILIDDVATAKGRLALKPQVEGFLKDLQKRTHDRSVGAFEQMLTGLTDDVLPDYRGQRQVKLKLGMSRDMPALDLYVDHMGKTEDITSGAVANVVSTGLRFIALARSGARRFLVLDEADCWIDGVAVENFFNVVNQLSKDAGIQTVVITHSDVSAFSDEFRMYRIRDIDSPDEWPARTMDLVCPGDMTPSEFQDDYLSFVSVKNFEAYPEAAIELSPGVTVITGPNQRGKSSWARMLRAAFMADCGDNIIRHDQNTAEIAVGFSDGRVLEYHRNQKDQKSSGKAEFAMHSPESWSARLSGVPLKEMREGSMRALHHTVGASTPAWMPGETGIYEIEGINVQLWPQFTPVFMLDQPASKRASLLSIGRESGHLFAMNELYKDDLKECRLAEKNGEKEIAAIRLTLGAHQGLQDTMDRLDRLRAEAEEIVADTEALKALEKLLADIQELQRQHVLLTAQSAVYARLPDMPKIEPTERLEAWTQDFERASAESKLKVTQTVPAVPDVEATEELQATVDAQVLARQAAELAARLSPLPAAPAIEDTSEIEVLAKNLAQAQRDAALVAPALPETPVVLPTMRLEDFVEKLNGALADARLPMPKPLPSAVELLETAELEQLLRDLAGAQRTVTANQQQLKTIEHDMSQIERELTRATDALGNECPVCHSIVTVDMLLGKDGHGHGHDHSHDAAESIALVTPSSLPSREEIAAARAAATVLEAAAEVVAAGAVESAKPSARGFRALRR